jgi:hypothetical protein
MWTGIVSMPIRIRIWNGIGIKIESLIQIQIGNKSTE